MTNVFILIIGLKLKNRRLHDMNCKNCGALINLPKQLKHESGICCVYCGSVFILQTESTETKG
jgi:DNA-directed RNA polymerase subunit RPC12/RpoP